jgi:hypothetical protein
LNFDIQNMTSEDQIWKPVKPSRVGLDFFSQLNSYFENYEKKNPNCFPRLRGCKDIIIASDYSGEHEEVDFSAYSFLMFDWNASEQWSIASSDVRKRFLSEGNREMSYKRLADKCRQRALVPFLKAADHINGLVISLLVNKQIGSVLESGGVAHLQQIAPSLANWKEGAVEKLYRIQTFLAFLHAGLCNPEQRTYWLTDNDQIVANPSRHAVATNMLQCFSRSHFAREICLESIDIVNSMDATIVGAAKDIASIPDLVGGALVDLWSAANKGLARSSSQLIPVPQEIPEKAKTIVKWFQQDDKPLRRYFAVIDLSEKDKNLIDFRWLKFS